MLNIFVCPFNRTLKSESEIICDIWTDLFYGSNVTSRRWKQSVTLWQHKQLYNVLLTSTFTYTPSALTASTHIDSHIHTSPGVLTCPLKPVYPSSLLYTSYMRVLLYVCVYHATECVLLPVRPWLPREQPNHWAITTPHTHTFTHLFLVPWFLHTVEERTSSWLAGMMDVFSESPN